MYFFVPGSYMNNKGKKKTKTSEHNLTIYLVYPKPLCCQRHHKNWNHWLVWCQWSSRGLLYSDRNSYAKDPISPPCMSAHICCFLPVWRLYGSRNMGRKQRLHGDTQQFGDEATRGFWWNQGILVGKSKSNIKEIYLPEYKYTEQIPPNRSW